MPRRLVGWPLALLLGAVPAAAASLQDGLAACRALPDATTRLDCYDALPLPGALSFHGSGGGMAGPFAVTVPQMLTFQSDDAILVAYLLDDATGAVVQNLHRGGAGTGHFLITNPGTYRVQINASGGWRIDLSAP